MKRSFADIKMRIMDLVMLSIYRIAKVKIEMTILIILPMLFLYRMIFFGEIVTTNDELERHPINQWTENYFVENDEIPQWFPNLFSGMPSYGGYIYTNGDPTKFLRNKILFNPGLKIWFYLSLSGIGMFIMLRLIGISRKSALLGAIISSLTPYTFGLINAGHLNKIFAMSYIPWVMCAAFYCIQNVNLRSILLLSLATALQLWANHPQIAYYTWMVNGFYFVWQVAIYFKHKQLSIQSTLYPLIGIIVALVIALFMVSDPYSDIYKFQKHSNRGESSVLDQSGQTRSGTDWDYATQWSFHPKETISFIYPYHYGLQNSQDFKKGAYWGYMPFTQSTHYLGLIAIIFAILGGLLKKPDKNDMVFWVIILLTLITGFGSFLPLLYKPFFSVLPFFSKFRIPSMIYVLLAVIFPILCAKGLDIFFNSRESKDTFKKGFYVVGTILVITTLMILFGESLFSFISAKDARYGPGAITKLKTFRIDLFNKGLFLTFSISLAVIGLIWGFLNKKINKQIFYYFLLLVTILDLWFINSEFMNLRPSKNMDKQFSENKIIDHIKKSPGHFRIFPADEMGTNKYSYWNIESIGGYRPIKLRNYQDMMDANGFSRPHILNMLNVKYVLTGKKINNPNFIPIKGNPGIFDNKNVLPKSWIVGNIISVDNQRESLMKTLLTSFDPSSMAVVVNYDGSDIPDNVSGSVEVIARSENKIELESESGTGGLLILSEIFYNPGWKVTVNNIESKIYQTNHILRSVFVPSGKSKIIFEYDKGDWKNTRLVSRISLFTVLLLIVISFRRQKIRP